MVSGAYVYLTHLTALGFGTTALPGLAIANPANNGYVNYIVAHLIALDPGILFTVLIGRFSMDPGILFTVLIGRFSKSEKEKKAQEKKLKEIPAVKAEPNVVYSPVKGRAAFIAECSDPVFNQKSMGDGMVFIPEEELIVSPVNGTIMMVFPTKHAIGIRTEEGTELFNQKSMGDGMVFIPEEELIVSPVNGTIMMVFPTKHAIGIRTEEGTELLIHMGLNTVSLEGRPFELYVGEGDTVKAGQKIVRIDLKAIEGEGLSTETPVVMNTVSLEGRPFELYVGEGDTVKAGQKIVRIDLKAIEGEGLSTETPVVITSMQPVPVQNTGTVNWGDSVMTITQKD